MSLIETDKHFVELFGTILSDLAFDVTVNFNFPQDIYSRVNYATQTKKMDSSALFFDL